MVGHHVRGVIPRCAGYSCVLWHARGSRVAAAVGRQAVIDDCYWALYDGSWPHPVIAYFWRALRAAYLESRAAF